MIAKLGIQIDLQYISRSTNELSFSRQLGFIIHLHTSHRDLKGKSLSMPDRQARVTCIKLTKTPTLTKNSGQPRSRSTLDRLTGQDLPCVN